MTPGASDRFAKQRALRRAQQLFEEDRGKIAEERNAALAAIKANADSSPAARSAMGEREIACQRDALLKVIEARLSRLREALSEAQQPFTAQDAQAIALSLHSLVDQTDLDGEAPPTSSQSAAAQDARRLAHADVERGIAMLATTISDAQPTPPVVPASSVQPPHGASGKRSAVKAITYRLLIVCLDFAAVYLLTGKIELAVGFMIVSNIYTTIGYFLHERLWARINWGRD